MRRAAHNLCASLGFRQPQSIRNGRVVGRPERQQTVRAATADLPGKPPSTGAIARGYAWRVSSKELGERGALHHTWPHANTVGASNLRRGLPPRRGREGNEPRRRVTYVKGPRAPKPLTGGVARPRCGATEIPTFGASLPQVRDSRKLDVQSEPMVPVPADHAQHDRKRGMSRLCK